jgi:hypothetical protein
VRSGLGWAKRRRMERILSVRKYSAIVVATVICGAVALAGIAMAATATTKVSIQAQQGGFFGYVHTKKAASEKCENGRKVILYKQKGSQQKPRDDTKIDTDIAQPNGPDSMWSINTNKSGKFYAKAPKKPGCATGFSETVHSQ